MIGRITAVAIVLALAGCGMVDEEADADTLAEEPFAADLSFMTVGMDLAEGAEGPASSRFEGRCSEPSDWVITFELSGQSPTLGPLTGVAEHCSQVLEWRTVQGTPAPSTVTYGDGRFQLVTAAGDTLTGTYGGGTGGLNPDGGMWFRDRFTFTGGTGRFLDAQGEGEEEGTFTDPQSPASMRMQGVLRSRSAVPTRG